VTATFERLRAASTSPTVRRWLLPVAFAAFAVTAGAAFASLPEGLDVEPVYLVASFLLVTPLSTLANAAEFAATAHAVGRRIDRAEALRVAVLSSAANLLPLPGAVAVRTHQLRGAAGTKRALGVTAGAGICWLGMSVAVAGLGDLVVNRRAVSGAAALIGAAIVGVAYVLVRRSATEASGWRWIILCELTQVAVAAARLALAVTALGSSLDLAQALWLAVSPVAGSAVGVLPGGLGVREAIAASIAALVDLPAAVGAAAAAVDRILGLVVVAALVPFARRRPSTEQAGKATADAETPIGPFREEEYE
jgi:hypothetical protein